MLLQAFAYLERSKGGAEREERVAKALEAARAAAVGLVLDTVTSST